MQKSKFILIFFFFSLNIIAQNLPKEYSISYEGNRLQKGVQDKTGVYDETKIRRIDLTFSQANWKTLLTQNYSSKTELVATLTMDGKVYPKVGVRYKGQTSYQRVTSDKKSFNITIDFTDSTQDIDGYETFNLNNSFEDNSFMKEMFYENYTRKYSPSLKVAYVHLYINGEDYGLYPNVQALDGQYIKEWFLNNNGTRWRCERTTGTPGQPGGGGGGGGGFGAGTSSLNYLGDDITLYQPHYTLKNTKLANPWQDLMRATKILANSSDLDSLNKYIDIDNALWFLAKEILFGDDDSYVNKGGMDYFAYHDVATGRLVPMEYDANSVMSGQTSSWDLFLKEANTQFPLCNKLFKIPALRQRYLAHIRTMAADLFNSNNYNTTIEKYFNLIDTLVVKDSKKLMTYEQFIAGKNSLKTWMNNRATFINNNTEIKQVSVKIISTEMSSADILNKSPNDNQSVLVKVKTDLTIKANKCNLYYGLGYDGVFKSVLMYDDGAHNDGTANDGVWAATIPEFSAGTYVRYYIEAIAANASNTASYMPEGAEHDVFIYRVNLLQSQLSEIVINEVVSANKTTAKDQENEYDDWVELYNTSSKDINLSRWILTDNPDNLDKYRIPNGTVIKANSYLIIWADEDGKQQGLHANFKLSADGEPLYLLDSFAKQVDFVNIPLLADDEAYARTPNGTGNFSKTKKYTFNKSNDGTTPTQDFKNTFQLKIYPNPAHQFITFESLTGKPMDLKIYNILGQLTFDKSLIRSNIDISDWPRGTYIAKTINQTQKFIVN